MADAMTLAAVLALASQCAPSLDQNLIAGIAKHESGLNPLVLHDNTISRRYAPGTASEARALAADLIHVQGHSVDLGFMQINSRNLAYLGLPESEAFDACHSIKAAATLLQSLTTTRGHRRADWPPVLARRRRPDAGTRQAQSPPSNR
jgi:type IV secretion system protein VirB1